MPDDVPDHHQIVATRKYNETSKAYENEKHEPWTFNEIAGSLVIDDAADKTTVPLAGPGILRGAHVLWTPGTGDVTLRLVIDGTTHQGWGILGLSSYDLTAPGASTMFCVKFDQTNNVYAVGISEGIHFTTSLAVKVSNNSGAQITATYILSANVQTP